MAGCCGHKAVLTLVALTFCTWAVSLGGLGSLSNMCFEPLKNTGYLAAVRGFSASSLDCTRVFSYYWWVIALEFALVCAITLSIFGGRFAAMRLAFTGLLAVACVLYTQSADSFLAITGVQHYQSSLEQHTARATAAGMVMTAALNMLLLTAVSFGSNDCMPACSSGCDAQGQVA